MRRTAALVLTAVAATACGSGRLFRQYEYEEDMYLALDGTATVYVNSSVAALDGLRGASFSTSPNAPLDRQAVLAFFTTPFTHDVSITTSRRSNRRFVHVRLEVDDVRRLGQAAPFAWSTYQFSRDGDLFVFRQAVGRAAEKQISEAGWTGGEVVAFRIHVPSKVVYHNALPDNLKRGNILVWEQSLRERDHGVPLVFDARMQKQSILYSTLRLFGATFVIVAGMFAVLIWWILRRGASMRRASA